MMEDGRMKIRLYIALLATVAALVGCDRDKDPAQGRPGRPGAKGDVQSTATTNAVPAARKRARPLPLIDRLPATGVVVRVNGTDITKKEFADWESLRVKIWAYAHGKPLDGKTEDVKRFRSGNRTRVIGELIKRVLISDYAKKNGISVSDDRMRAEERKFLKSVKRPKAKFDSLAAKFGEDGFAQLKAAVAADALAGVVIEKTSTNDLRNVTEEEITNRVEFVKRLNDEADRKNAIAREKAAKAKAEILAGAKFAEVAAKYSEYCPEYGSTWESVRLDEFEGDDPLLKWLVGAKVGDISDPIDLDDGISIVGLKMMFEAEPAEDGKAAVMEYELVRCCFYAYEKQEVIEDRQELVEDMLELRRERAMEELRQKLTESVEIEFPSGRNLFYAEQKPAKAKAKAKKGGKPKPKKKQAKKEKTK